MVGPRVGALIAATAGTVFILVNAGSLTDQAALAVRVGGALAGAAVIVTVCARRKPGVQVAPPTRAAWRLYWTVVTVEAGLLVIGSRVLSATSHEELATSWVALIVGAHFLPFARAFNTPVFSWLGWTLIALGVAGGVAATLAGEAAGAVVSGVLSGVVLLAFAVLFDRGQGPVSAESGGRS